MCFTKLKLTIVVYNIASSLGDELEPDFMITQEFIGVGHPRSVYSKALCQNAFKIFYFLIKSYFPIHIQDFIA